MKKILKMTAAFMSAAILLCSCGGSASNANASDLLNAAANSGAKFEELEKVEGDILKFNYEMDETWYTDVAAMAAGNMAYADEIVVVKASSTDNVKNVESALEKRVENRKNVLQSYAPAEYDKLCNSKVKTNGDYVYLIVGSDINTAEDALKKAF